MIITNIDYLFNRVQTGEEFIKAARDVYPKIKLTEIKEEINNFQESTMINWHEKKVINQALTLLNRGIEYKEKLNNKNKEV